MAEVVEKAGVQREKGFLYFLRGSDVYKQIAGRGRQGVPSKVYNGTFEREAGYMYFIDKEGNIARTPMSVGRKPVGRKAKPAAAKKPAARPRGRRA